MRPYLLIAAIAILTGMPRPAETYKLRLTTGERIGNIFSRTIAITGEGFTPYAVRVSGTCEYTVRDSNPDSPAFDTHWIYDGAREGRNMVYYDHGGARVSYKTADAFTNNTDGSGVLYNPLIWGSLPQKIEAGTSWEVSIPVAWELGGPGKQTVTVLAAEPTTHSLTLQREGTSEGPFDHDYLSMEIMVDGKKLAVHATPGPAHWTGWSTFSDGLVRSDELLVTRDLTLTAGTQTFKAQEREYILLNRMP